MKLTLEVEPVDDTPVLFSLNHPWALPLHVQQDRGGVELYSEQVLGGAQTRRAWFAIVFPKGLARVHLLHCAREWSSLKGLAYIRLKLFRVNPICGSW